MEGEALQAQEPWAELSTQIEAGHTRGQQIRTGCTCVRSGLFMKQPLQHGGDRSALPSPQPRIAPSPQLTHRQAPLHTCLSGPRSIWLVACSERVLPGVSGPGRSLERLLPHAGWRQHADRAWRSPGSAPRLAAVGPALSASAVLCPFGKMAALEL